MSCKLHSIYNVVNEFWNFKILKISHLLNCDHFLSLDNKLLSSQFFLVSQNFFIKRALNLDLCIYFWTWFLVQVHNFKLKIKPKIWSNEFEFPNIHINHLALFFMINMIFTWQCINICTKYVACHEDLTWFLPCLNLFSPLPYR